MAWIKLQRGISQGCPASSFLCTICISILTNKLEKTLMGSKFQLINYIDDFAVIVQSPIEVQQAFTLFELFNPAGIKLNQNIGVSARL